MVSHLSMGDNTRLPCHLWTEDVMATGMHGARDVDAARRDDHPQGLVQAALRQRQAGGRGGHHGHRRGGRGDGNG